MEINRAKEIIEALAEGIDPTTGEVLSDDNVCNKGEVVRAFYAVMEELKPKRSGKPTFDNYDEELFETLKTVRKMLAENESRPIFLIFSNDSLKDMAAKAPTTQVEFLEVFGVGAYKAEQYSDVFIEAIKQYLKDKV